MKTKIRIPKDVFEKTGLNKKEKLVDTLAGGVQYGLDKDKPVTQPNAEIEKGEWILDSQGLRQAKGPKHEDGGIDVLLEDKSKILSNFTDIGKQGAKELTKNLDVNIKKSDTFAKALEKVYTKLGLNKLQDEQKAVIKKLDKQQSEVKDANTLSLNTEVLSSKINDIENKKEVPLQQATDVFNSLFDRQESRKPKEEVKNSFQTGGRIGNKYEDEGSYIRQHLNPTGSTTYGNIDKTQTAEEIKRLFPDLYTNSFGEGIKPNNAAEFQANTEAYYDGLLESSKKLYGETSPKYKQLQTAVLKDRFSKESNVRGLDGKFGNYTSTRPNFQLELLPAEIQQKLANDGINTYGQLLEKNPEIADRYIPTDLGLPKDVWLGPIMEPTPQQVEEQTLAVPNKEEEAPSEDLVSEQVNSENRTGVMMLPAMDPRAPSGMDNHLKTNTRVPYQQFEAITPDRQLYQLQSMRSESERNIDMLPPAQRAAVIADMTSSYQDKASDIITQVSMQNKAGFEAVTNYNNQVISKQEASDAQNALSYEQRQLLAKAKTEADQNNFLNTLERNNIGRFNTIDNLNKLNLNSEHYQFTDRGLEVKTNPFIGLGSGDADMQKLLKEQEAKSKTNKKTSKTRFK